MTRKTSNVESDECAICKNKEKAVYKGLKVSLILGFSQILGMIVSYMLHDWYSGIILIWLAHCCITGQKLQGGSAAWSYSTVGLE